jgi:hypothetical protein
MSTASALSVCRCCSLQFRAGTPTISSFKVAQASDAFIKTLQLLGISDEALLPKEILK